MAYYLEKPYTNQERANFITLHNHQNGRAIRQTETQLIALEENEVFVNGEVVVDEEYYKRKEEEAKKKEAERINSLFMTRSDFFDGTIKAWGVDGDELLVIIQNLLATMEINDIEKKIAINNYKNALNFYRKHPLFEMLSDVVIPINETTPIRIQAENWDKFFDETNKGNEEAYKWLYPIGEVATEEVVEENGTN